MKDRVPANPGRVLITPEDGSAAFYATVTRADNPTQAGDPIAKKTFLKDATAALYGLGADAVPDDVLAAIKQLLDSKPKIETGSYVGTGVYGEDNKNTLTFGFVPKVVFIVPDTSTQKRGNGLILMHGASLFGGFGTFYSTSGTVIRNSVSISWAEKTVSWYSYGDPENEAAQQNVSGVTYRYIAFC